MYPDCDPSVGRLGRKGLKNSREAQERYSEKRCEEYERRPYRKPTQVDEERILRPTGEGVPSKDGRSEKAQATVYQKHRSLLKRKLKYRG